MSTTPARATPLVRRRAALAGVELADVRATGVGGRITTRDVAAASADLARWVVPTQRRARR